MVRKPAVAGYFYPGDREELLWWLREHMEDTPSRIYRAKGVLSPHAGYLYSGKIAAKVYGKIVIPDLAIIMGPNHTGLGPRASVMAKGRWETPLGIVDIDEELAEQLLSLAPVLEEDYTAHLREHSVEVQLPFLQFMNPAIKIVPIVLYPLRFSEVMEIAKAIALALNEREEKFLIVASSDMSHYLPSHIAKEKDFKAIEEILRLDGRGLMEVVYREEISMCGYIPASIMVEASKLLGAKRAELVAYSHSGEVTGEEPVVGYAGVVVY